MTVDSSFKKFNHFIMRLQPDFSLWEINDRRRYWIPAYAGMTGRDTGFLLPASADIAPTTA